MSVRDRECCDRLVRVTLLAGATMALAASGASAAAIGGTGNVGFGNTGADNTGLLNVGTGGMGGLLGGMGGDGGVGGNGGVGGVGGNGGMGGTGEVPVRVPEPSGLAVFGTGLLALLLCRRSEGATSRSDNSDRRRPRE